MDLVGVNVIETAALGRPFQLGMLYDCRKDALIPGVRLWNKEQLLQNICARPQVNTEFDVTESDTIKEKSKLLNINGELKLSFLGDLIHVSGAAKYLKDTKSSFIQQRLTLHYKSTSRFEELTIIDALNKSPFGENLPDPNGIGTHVVTAILYGANACFVFDRDVSKEEDESNIKGEVKAALEKLQSIVSVGAKAKITSNENQKDAVNKFTCTFHGDFQLPFNPTTFEDALQVFADLPKLLKESQELAVPLRVWLYPLNKLHSKASKLLKDISMELITEIESVIESLNTAEMKCSDLLKDSPVQVFAPFKCKIEQMKQNCYLYKLRLMNKLGSLLPNIRGDVMKETELNKLLQEHEASPFRGSDLTEWLKERERESEIIETILKQLKDVKIQVNIDAIRMNLEVGNLVSYTFTSLNCSDWLLFQQTAYLNPTKQETDEKRPDFKEKCWLTNDVLKVMRINLKLFKDLIDSEDLKPTTFIVSSKEMESNPGSCILLYESDHDEAVFFSPPSQPVCPVIEELRENSVVLQVPPSSDPHTVELRLLYKPQQDSVWMSQAVLKDQHTVTLTDLRTETEYELKCAALGKLNYTRESDVIHLRLIEKTLITRIESVIENLGSIENKCSELLKDIRTNTFSAFHKKFEDMKQFCQIYRRDFNDKIQLLIQSVQACEKETRVLTDLLQTHEESPFNTKNLMEWIRLKETELNTVGGILQQLLESGAEENTSLDTVFTNINVKNVVCYTFSSLEQPDQLLSQLDHHLNSQELRTWKNPENSPQSMTWLTGNIRENMREQLIIFKELMRSHDSPSVKFIVSTQDYKAHPGSCILLYESDHDEAVFFSPPSQPVCPVIEELSENSVVLQVPPSSDPHTVKLRLLYKPQQDSVWMSKAVLKDQHTVTLTDLRTETEYEIKCAALGKLDYTKESDTVILKQQSTRKSKEEEKGLSNVVPDGELEFVGHLIDLPLHSEPRRGGSGSESFRETVYCNKNTGETIRVSLLQALYQYGTKAIVEQVMG
nr:verrucotoxin subunit beta-like [Danio rerio]|eukprot:XP_021327680.1 verrucotoxin subunit beta-like [Danio rerio]